MIMAEKQITGYHGTSREAADQILESKIFNNSSRKYEWLGNGVYFFKYYDHAKKWITHDRFISHKTAILQALLTYSDDQLLDLDDPSAHELFEQVVKEMLEKTDFLDKPYGFVNGRPKSDKELQHRRCIACNYFRQIFPEIGIIMYTFPMSKRHTSCNLYPYNQCQICVYDRSIISDIKEARV